MSKTFNFGNKKRVLKVSGRIFEFSGLRLRFNRRHTEDSVFGRSDSGRSDTSLLLLSTTHSFS